MQYWTDFSQNTVNQSPSDWVSRHVGGTNDDVVIDTGIPAGGGEKVWYLSNPTVIRKSPTFVPDSGGDVDMVVRYLRTNPAASGTGTNAMLRLAFYGEEPNSHFYYSDQYMTTIQMNKWVNGTHTNINNSGVNSHNMPLDTWIIGRFRYSNGVLQSRMWLDGDPEPVTWDIEAVHSDPALTGGFFYLGKFYDTAFYVDWVGFGTEGDPAPTEIPVETFEETGFSTLFYASLSGSDIVIPDTEAPTVGPIIHTPDPVKE